MQKEKLRKLRALNVTPAMIKRANEDITITNRYGYYENSYTTQKYPTLARAQNLGGIIKVAIFTATDIRKGIKTPKYEVFVDEKAQQFITRKLFEDGTERRWLTAMLCNLQCVCCMNFYSYHSVQRQSAYLTQDTVRTLNRLVPLGNPDKETLEKNKGLQRLLKWQQSIHEDAIAKAEAKQKAPWDADMALVPKLPETFAEWMRRDVCKDRYIFYEYQKSGAKEGYCSRCKTRVPISNPKHNELAVCPACKTRALFKATGKSKRLSTDAYYGQIIQKVSGGIVVRLFTQRQIYAMSGTNINHSRTHSYDNPRIDTHEFERILIMDDGSVRRYSWESYKNKEIRWCFTNEGNSYYSYYWAKRMPLYKRNYNMIQDAKIFKQSAIGLWKELPMSVPAYLEAERGNPAIEMLAKMGMFKLAKSLIDCRYDHTLLKEDATEIAKMLRVDNNRMKRLQAMDADLKHLRWMQLEKLANTIWPDTMIQELSEAGINPSDFNFLDAPINYTRSYNYLKKQAELMSETLHQTITTWRDYLYMACQLKMNTKLEQISRPKDLRAAHDECVMIRESKDIEKEAAGLRKKYPKAEKHLEAIKKFEFEKGKYAIIAPKKLEDIVLEGRILKHCVHTCDYYFNRISTDESYLFFLRKANAKDMPWYTLEVEPSGNIRQKRTTGDNQNKDFDDAIPFLQEWQKYFAKQLTAKEKKLGAKADQLRKENYKELRKKQSKIWHGKLAGQLLADVLEADFMAAPALAMV